MAQKKVMITGVYGLIAGAIYNHLTQFPNQYDVYGLARRRQDSDRVAPERVLNIPDDKFKLDDLSDLDNVIEAFSGLDVVVHMAADPSGQAGWESVLKSNLIGGYNAFEACRQAGVKRIIFASSIQVSSGYRQEEPYSKVARGEYDGEKPIVEHTMPTRPMNIYASSKVWGEALARTYADAHGLSCLCIRIGWVVKEDRPPRLEAGDIWCSQRDIVSLSRCCIDASDEVQFDIFYGMSDNANRWVDIAHARRVVGYVPQDQAEDRH